MALHDGVGIERRGLMFVLSGPSGAGATTLSRLLVERVPGLRMSMSVTTRAMRPGEVDGQDYLFVDQARFEDLVKRHELLEWATVFGNQYGTPREPVEAALSAGRDVLFDIDWQGTQQLREKARADLVSVFILTPSLADLEERMYSRAQDSAAVIRARMSRAGNELSHWPEYDYVIINDDIDAAFAEVLSILQAERLKRERQIGLPNHIRTLGAARSQATGSGRSSTIRRFQGDVFQEAAFRVETNATQSWGAAFELLQARVALLEAALASRPTGMGHNQGPTLDDGLSVDEAEIRQLISLLKQQPPTGPVDGPKLLEAAQIADPAKNKWRQRVDELSMSAVKGGATAVGKHVVERLMHVQWFSSVYSALEAVFNVLKSCLF